MKRCILIILSLILVLYLTSCSFKKDIPETVTIDDKEYKRAFTGDLYPIDDGFMGADGVKKFGHSYRTYSETQFDCYIAYDDDAEPQVYFEKQQFDEAVSYYNNAESFNFYCLTGNIHDTNDHKIFEIHEIDSSMFNQLLEFSEKYEYNPLASLNNEDGFTKVPITDTVNWMSYEIHFYKESKDGAFTTSRAHTFVLHENELCFLYQYDFSKRGAPFMIIRSIPTEVSNYFCSLLEDLEIK